MFSAPNHVNFLLTHRCNLHCSYCYVPFQSFPEELRTEQVIRTIDLLYERGVFSLDLTGGEPLLRNDIIEILDHCNDLDMDVGLATNGVLLTAKKVTELSKVWDKKRTVHVSVDASTPEKFHEITGSNNFSDVLECTRALLEYDLDVIWNFVYIPQNKDDLAPVCSMATDLGVPHMFVLPLIEVGRAVDAQFSFGELQAFLVHFPEIEVGYPSIHFRVTPATPLDFLVPLLEAGWDTQTILKHYPYARTPLQDEKYREIRALGCIGGVGRWAINAQGDVFPCELVAVDNRLKCGNILEDSFETCLRACSSIFDIGIEEIGGCSSCKYKTICGGGCRARALAKHGDVRAPDPLCPFVEKKIILDKGKQGKRAVKWSGKYERKVFSIKIHGSTLRVRKESFGGTVYLPGREQQIYLNRDGYAIFEELRKTHDENMIVRELRKRNLPVSEKSVHDFLEYLYEVLAKT